MHNIGFAKQTDPGLRERFLDVTVSDNGVHDFQVLAKIDVTARSARRAVLGKFCAHL